jgi:TolB protein
MSLKIVTIAFLIVIAALPSLSTQDSPSVTIRPRPNEEIILAVPDIQPANKEKAGEISEALKTFNQVLWDDLSFSGYFTMAGRSYYPVQPIVQSQDINYEAWNSLPFKVSFLTAGTLGINGNSLTAELKVFDMKGHSMSFGSYINGNTDQVRLMAHRWADEIVYKLTAGASRGIASTKIAYCSRKGNAKEVYIADYDGFNPQAFTHNGELNLFPNWAPDNSKLAFISHRTGKWEINIHSYLDGSRIAFPMFNTHSSTPAISPDGTEVAFALQTPRGDADLYISKLDADGSNRRNITNNPAIDQAPTWSPSGGQIAFATDRIQTGATQIHICDADGSNVRRIVKEGGDSDSPAWSPDGKWIAFHWKPRMGIAYDIFIAEVATGKIRQLTNSSGSNEGPSWAPDGRHLTFQSNRTGTNQLYIMLLDGTELRMITRQGNNSSPAWSGYFRTAEK